MAAIPPARDGATAAADSMDLSSLLSSLPASSTASTLAFDGPSLLSSLNSYGLATDLSPSDLSLTLPSTSSSQLPSSSSSSSNSTLSILLSRLSLLLSDLSRLLEAQIRESLPALLDETAKIQGLQKGVWDLRKGISEVDGAIEKVGEGTKVGVQRLRRDQRRLKRLFEISELLRLASRFVLLARRLEGSLRALFDEGDEDGEDGGTAGEETEETQQRKRQHQRNREEALVRSARGITAIRHLLQANPSLGSIAFVVSYQPSIASARSQLLDTMERFIVLGLRDLSPSMLSSSLLTASMLGVLKDLVKDLMTDLTDVVRKRVEAAFVSSASLVAAEDAGYPSYKARRPGQSVAGGARSGTTQGQQELVARLETLFSLEMTAVCSKIYLLQRVLGLMRNTEPVGGEGEEQPEGQAAGESTERGTLLDEGVKILGDPPTLLFWRSLSSALSSSSSTLPPHLAIPASPFLANETRRLVDLFFEKTSVWTGIAVGIEKKAMVGAGAGGGGGAEGVNGQNSVASANSSAERVFVLRSLGL
ncbi:hypothetical protein BCV69DRAFT_301564 [Microstroma glucosiphilum]|uniref:Conserved oligomeric Golgi complex subunit 5 n=1 Tax=Pseudomicrostroma glucosiphilum TaxID=1684307 RepID=A0A316TZP0_9BASI|nr:hypothetical protein BCV69DRAFT_301564 [Pseudomicrostroma glucosiphilum]PWN18108.1 hypothetical protein BCV69DRAFT_301564 [Pseudomicrostroma glucosiphilum]